MFTKYVWNYNMDYLLSVLSLPCIWCSVSDLCSGHLPEACCPCEKAKKANWSDVNWTFVMHKSAKVVLLVKSLEYITFLSVSRFDEYCRCYPWFCRSVHSWSYPWSNPELGSCFLSDIYCVLHWMDSLHLLWHWQATHLRSGSTKHLNADVYSMKTCVGITVYNSCK